MALIDFASIADGVMSDATTTDGARSDLASLCLKTKWWSVSPLLLKRQLACWKKLKEVLSLLPVADVPCLCDKILQLGATKRCKLLTSEKIIAQIRLNTAKKTSAFVQSLIAPPFSSLPLHWHVNECVYVDGSCINLFVSLQMKL